MVQLYRGDKMHLFWAIRPYAVPRRLLVVAHDGAEARKLVEGLGNNTKITIQPVRMKKPRILTMD